VILVMAYGQILPKALLDLPRLACLNLHASLLPRHRGAAPIQAAIEAGDTETGITVMYMAEGLDTGDMLLAHRIPITPTETAGSLHDRLAEITPGALAEAVPLGIMVEPPYGEPDVPSLLSALAALDRDMFAVIEQDLYPIPSHMPLAIQARAAGYFTALGPGPVRRWPY